MKHPQIPVEMMKKFGRGYEAQVGQMDGSIYVGKPHGLEQGMDFGAALIALRFGKKVARDGWNGNGMFLFLVPGSRITVSEGRPLAAHLAVGTDVDYLPHIDMKTAQGGIVPWLASQTDILAEDWRVIL